MMAVFFSALLSFVFCFAQEKDAVVETLPEENAVADVSREENSAVSDRSESNAAAFYKEATEALAGVPEDFDSKADGVIKNGWKEEDDGVEAILKENQKAMEIFKKAADVKYCDFTFGKPIKKTPVTPMPFPPNIFRLVKLVLLEARLYEKRDKWDLALDDYIIMLKCQQHFNHQENFVLISNMMAIYIQDLGYSALSQYISREGLTAWQCKKVLDALVRFKRNRLGIERAFAEEKEMMGNIIQNSSEEEEQQGFLKSISEEFSKYIEEFFGYAAAAYKDNNQSILEEYKEKANGVKEEVRKAIEASNLDWDSLKDDIYKGQLSGKVSDPVLAGKILATVLIMEKMPEMYGRIIINSYSSLSKFNVLIAAAAVRSYEIKNGKIPEALEQLVPEYIPELPLDPFNEFKPIRYERRADGWSVYGVGFQEAGE